MCVSAVPYAHIGRVCRERAWQVGGQQEAALPPQPEDHHHQGEGRGWPLPLQGPAQDSEPHSDGEGRGQPLSFRGGDRGHQ